jgi:ankyrin repeat protein
VTKAAERLFTGPLPKASPSPIYAFFFQRQLFLTICSGNLPFVQALLADSNVNARDERGCTPLHLAAAGGFHVVVSALLQAKAKANVVDNVG